MRNKIIACKMLVLLISALVLNVASMSLKNIITQYPDAVLNRTRQMSDGTIERTYIIDGGSIILWGPQERLSVIGLLISKETSGIEGITNLVRFINIYFDENGTTGVDVLEFITEAWQKPYPRSSYFNKIRVTTTSYSAQYYTVTFAQ